MAIKIFTSILATLPFAFAQAQAVSSFGLVWESSGTPTITVSDTGSGIEESFLNTQLFRPFATTKKHGLGLGLYQCRSIIRAHNGTLTATSQPGTGTTFKIILKTAPLETSAKAVPAGAPGGIL